MQESMYIAASAGMVQQRKLEITSNNLANVGSTGFKQDGLVFQEMLTPQSGDPHLDAPRQVLLPPGLNNQSVSYVGLSGFSTDFSQGAVKFTGNPLDLALEGDGFFVVDAGEGARYTRKGNFQLDDKNRLVNPEGFPLISRTGKPVTIPPNLGAVSIDAEGSISVGAGGQSIGVGQLKLVTIEDKSTLVKEGASLFRYTGAAEIPSSRPKGLTVLQGFVENANVNAVAEMVTMIQTLRAFEAMQKLIQSIDDANGQSINNLARVA
ncbi:MAG: flagellar basal-body rod protein FlgF [Nitrospinaceae bacterium]